jgi:hypothetical protein
VSNFRFGFWDLVKEPDTTKTLVKNLLYPRNKNHKQQQRMISSPGGVCKVVDSDRRTRRGRILMGDLASGGLRSVLILDILREVSPKKTVYKES